MWFGIGEDGHTLSLFPDHKDFVDGEDSVIAVRDSPKPPAERISFSLSGLSKVKSAIIFATGASKRQALHQVFNGQRLPIRQVAERLIDSKADVMWLFDEEARATSL
jgi:6-phosphogluconolactonase